MPVKEISEGTLKRELTNAGEKLVLVDFFATWCGPCKMIAPAIDNLSTQHPHSVFLKVDVDKCQTEAQENNITAMPTFVFYRSGKELERIRGADAKSIEAFLQKHGQAQAFGGQGYSMVGASSSATTATSTTEQAGDKTRIEKLATEKFSKLNDGETTTTLRLRLPDISAPIQIKIGVQRTLNDVRQFLSTVLKRNFEFIEPPATKIKVEDEIKTLIELKLTNAMVVVRNI